MHGVKDLPFCFLLAVAVEERYGEVGDNHCNIEKVDKENVIGADRHRLGTDARKVAKEREMGQERLKQASIITSRISDTVITAAEPDVMQREWRSPSKNFLYFHYILDK